MYTESAGPATPAGFCGPRRRGRLVSSTLEMVYSGPMPISANGKALVRLGVVTLMTAALASVWELFALQAPGTPFYLGVLPGPITVLREMTTVIGLLLVGAGLTQCWAGGRGERVLVALAYAGTLLGVGAQAYGAANGMNGVQLRDLRADALPLFLAKHGGLLLLLLALFEHGRRLLVRPPNRQPGNLIRTDTATKVVSS